MVSYVYIYIYCYRFCFFCQRHSKMPCSLPFHLYNSPINSSVPRKESPYRSFLSEGPICSTECGIHLQQSCFFVCFERALTVNIQHSSFTFVLLPCFFLFFRFVTWHGDRWSGLVRMAWSNGTPTPLWKPLSFTAPNLSRSATPGWEARGSDSVPCRTCRACLACRSFSQYSNSTVLKDNGLMKWVSID